MSELKPCPFCGGAVELERTIDDREWWGVVCRNTLNLGGSCAVSIRASASKEAAIERWNRRVPVAVVLPYYEHVEDWHSGMNEGWDTYEEELRRVNPHITFVQQGE